MAFKESNKDSSLYAYTDKLINQLDDRIKLKEEIEKQWKARLDSAEKMKSDTALKHKSNEIKAASNESQNLNSSSNTQENNTSTESQQPLNTVIDPANYKKIEGSEGKPSFETEPQINKFEKKTLQNTELPEEQLGVDPTIPPKKK